MQTKKERDMKRVLTLLAVGVALLMVFGCSDSPAPTNSTIDMSEVQLVVRPQFVDTRPQATIQQFTMQATPNYILYKKPPPPPPDTGTADPNPNPAHKYAYVVGISDYEGTANDLQFCDEDAVAVKAYLQSQGFTVRMDLDGAATADGITAGLDWLAASAEPGDEIAFAYSGHGAKAPTYGSSLISADLYYITHGYVMERINGANCSKKHIGIDACVVGDFHEDCETGSIMATASTRTFSYDAPDLEHGAWTYYWLYGAEVVGLEYAEDIATYAEDGMADWASTYKLKVTPAHTDMYTGMMDL